MTPEKRFLELFAQGYERSTRADLAGANALYVQALAALGDREHPQLTAIYANLAQNALALGQTDEGWRYFDRALTRALDGETGRFRLAPNTWHQLAWILYERGELVHAAQALELVERALAGEDRLETHDTRMRILLKLGRQREARQVAVAALRRDFAHRDFQDVKECFGLTSLAAVEAAATSAARGPSGGRGRARRPEPAPRSMSSRPPRSKRIDELGEWKGRRPSSMEPLLELSPHPAADSPRAQAQEALRRSLRHSSLLEGPDAPRTPSTLAAVASDVARSPYAQVDAALGLALLGDERAVPVLRRVLVEPMYAITNSLNEQGLAALGLALLGQTEDLPRIRLCPRINSNAFHVDLAIRILEQKAYD